MLLMKIWTLLSSENRYIYGSRKMEKLYRAMIYKEKNGIVMDVDQIAIIPVNTGPLLKEFKYDKCSLKCFNYEYDLYSSQLVELSHL